MQALEEFGKKLGLAFQIIDDLLDVAGDESATGKRVGKDSTRGKLTYPGLIGVEQSRRLAAETVEAACTALAPLGPRSARLESLARFVINRNH
jgi:geranylgeranyl diphosphate synthase type II